MSRENAAKALPGGEWVGLRERLDTPRVRQALGALGLEDFARWSQGLEGDDRAMTLAAELARPLAERAGELRGKGHEECPGPCRLGGRAGGDRASAVRARGGRAAAPVRRR